MSAHYSKENLRQLIMKNFVCTATWHYYAFSSFIDLFTCWDIDTIKKRSPPPTRLKQVQENKLKINHTTQHI